ncbi:hypothetical protein IMCC3317_09100 [Kordia antarctica]|uniref:DUF6438 domain-containing protein n=1 Tax=Kordia antarctica TaxID=1218801 RepID=A0A7L4ZI12_9FLAO|nr:DUF6438 domain-containing protein [Kordia antarctica]QHI35564.1 hypothetical protein IMCC3317_09100 [Kordia antarctica]
MKNIIYSVLLFLLMCNCTNNTKKETLKDRIQGSWVDSNAEKVRNDNYVVPFKIPFGLNFQKDSVDFFRQFAKYERDTSTHKMNFNAFAGFIPFQLKADSLFILNPIENHLEFKYTIDASLKDTLFLKRNDTLLRTLKRLQKQEKDTTSFDQIVLSRSGCYGICPVINISVRRNGNVLFYGERNTDKLGLYKAQLSEQFTNYLFQKFEDINISKVADNYSVGHTDDETVSTTFFQNGKIIKTIQDYGKAGTKELLWTYQAIENLHKQLELTSISIDSIKPAFNDYYFEKESKRLSLKQSESFLLWYALQNAKVTTINFDNIYNFGGVYIYRNKYLKIESDGRFFKYFIKKGQTITYDIGYNFIERNFKEADFKDKKTSY